MTEKEIKNLWSCLLSLKDCGEITDAEMCGLAVRFGLLG